MQSVCKQSSGRALAEVGERTPYEKEKIEKRENFAAKLKPKKNRRTQ